MGEKCNGKPVRVLVTDDSLAMRRMIHDILASADGIDVVGMARDGVEALELAYQIKPDVITLDVEMPHMNGMEVLVRLMKENPIPVVIVSGLASDNINLNQKYMDAGASDCVPKPYSLLSLDLQEVGSQIVSAVRRAAAKRANRPISIPQNRDDMAMPNAVVPNLRLPWLVGLAASVGGPAALSTVISQIPPDLNAAIIVVQHLPLGFSKSLAERLNSISEVEVKEAEEDEAIRSGTAYLSKGGMHLEVSSTGRFRYNDCQPVCSVKPSADVLFRSLASRNSANTIGVVLTGMGQDGAEGIRAIASVGGYSIAQDEKTSLIFGMPKEAIATGCVNEVLPLTEIAMAIIRQINRTRIENGALSSETPRNRSRVA